VNNAQLSTAGLTLLALLAFAANSILCRLALSVEAVPPLDFTIIRIFSAALTLWLLLLVRGKAQLSKLTQHGSTAGAGYLLIYLVGFSFAYVQLGTASGALLLFAAVQFTMLLAHRISGHRLSVAETTGVMISLVGFLYFVYPQLNTPDILSCVWMMMAGVAWGLYSLNGARSVAPLEDTASNFIRLLPLALIASVFIAVEADINDSLNGIFYAVLSGSLASGLGYALWYLVLPRLAKSLAAVCQLSVPIWAALGGLWLVDEELSLHLIFSAILVLGGIAVVLLSRLNPAK
jgi:drug/metabolite transporter (DMT)-like permease